MCGPTQLPEAPDHGALCGQAQDTRSVLHPGAFSLLAKERKETGMTWKDKAELGLKEDAQYRKDNLPPSQIRGPALLVGPGRSPEISLAREDHTQVPEPYASGDTVASTPPKPGRARSTPATRRK